MPERVIKINSINMINWLYNGFFPSVFLSYKGFIMNCKMTAKVRFLGFSSMEIFIHCRTC